MARSVRGRPPRRAHIGARYIAVAAVFLVLCVAFVIVLAVYQANGSSTPTDGGYIRTYTVPGVRGEIYDKNGTLIVGNESGYDLVYEYGAMPDSRREINLELLSTLEILQRTKSEDCLSEDLFVLEGTYPDVRFVPELSDRESSVYQRYLKFLERRGMTESDTDADDVAAYFVKRYSLSTTLYSNEQITELIRLYYEMERVDFGSYASYTIAEKVPNEVISVLEETGVEGVVFVSRRERVYHYPGVASHILGRVGKITAENKDYYLSKGYSLDALVGTSGVEAAFEDWLHGQDGVRVVKYDVYGRMVDSYYDPEPVSGKDVYLTIDIDLQLAAENGLKESVDAISTSEAGAITVLDPNSGAILASASYPTYDLTKFDSQSYVDSLNQNPNNPWSNRALQGAYAPGSTYKIGMALSALETGTIGGATSYFCDHAYEGLTCLGTHGSSNVVDAIRDSCNVFFYHLGEIMGVRSATQYTRRLGLGVPTGVELGEAKGTLATDGSNAVNMMAAIGQADHAYTPLQLSVYLSGIVNGGSRYEAHLLDSVRAFYTGEVLASHQTKVMDRVEFSDTTYDLLIEGMRQVVAESDTLSRTFRNVPVTVGGKTGTAEVENKTDYALFCGFAPLKNPEIVVSCVLEEGAIGARAATPVAKVMEVYFQKQTKAASAE